MNENEKPNPPEKDKDNNHNNNRRDRHPQNQNPQRDNRPQKDKYKNRDHNKPKNKEQEKNKEPIKDIEKDNPAVVVTPNKEEKQQPQHNPPKPKQERQDNRHQRDKQQTTPPPKPEKRVLIDDAEVMNNFELLPKQNKADSDAEKTLAKKEREENATPRPIIGITIGDMNGIGIEIIIKTFHDIRMLDFCTPVIYGSSRALSFHRKAMQMEEFSYHIAHNIHKIKHGICNVINCWTDEVPITIGKPNKKMGEYALQALDAAAEDLKNQHIEAIVTAPINKHQVNTEKNGFVGHTEYLTQKFDAPNSVMLLVSDNLKVGLVTNHLPVKDIADNINPALIRLKLSIINQSLIEDFGILGPRIAVLALNPHAGDEGLIGHEDNNIIKPAIEKANQEDHIRAFGPFAADGFFGAGLYRHFDAILAMYHDQGLIPFKTLSFGHGVNYTAGLPIIRTSPDHGTAYDIAGKNLASEESFRSAIFMALDIAKKRQNYADMNANPLQRGLAAKAGLVTREGSVA